MRLSRDDPERVLRCFPSRAGKWVKSAFTRLGRKSGFRSLRLIRILRCVALSEANHSRSETAIIDTQSPVRWQGK